MDRGRRILWASRRSAVESEDKQVCSRNFTEEAVPSRGLKHLIPEMRRLSSPAHKAFIYITQHGNMNEGVGIRVPRNAIVAIVCLYLPGS